MTQPDAGDPDLDLEQTLVAVAEALNGLESRLAAVETDGAEGLRLAAESLENLGSRLDAVEESIGTGRPTGQDQPEELEQWVTWLTDTYMLSGLLSPGGKLPSWSEVPAMRNELDALRIAARKAFGEKASPWDPASWHDQLDRALARFPTHRERFISMRDF